MTEVTDAMRAAGARAINDAYRDNPYAKNDEIAAAVLEAALAARPEPEGMEPPLLAKALRELSAAMSERNMDMELPDGTIDPTVAAEAIDRLSAEIASLKARLALLQASERVMTQTAREQQLRAEAAEARLAEAEAEKGDITHLLAEAVDDGAHLRAVIREAKTDKAKAVKAEREVCADIIESFTLGWPFTRADVAAAIRARGGSDALP